MQQAVNYQLTVTNSIGCSRTSAVSITFNIVCNAICFPKTITTNNAKRNDDLGPLGNIDVVGEYAIFNYNRCGALFFISRNPY